MNDPSLSTALPPIHSTASCSSSSPKTLPSLDVLVLEGCIDDVLSALTDKGLSCRLLESGIKLRDIVQPVASDFSKLFGSVSEGTQIISGQKSSSSKLSSQAHSVALEAVKELGNIHWAAIGLLAIANVLERFDKISANDRDCLDLLKVMLDLAKFLKQLKDMNADSQKEISEKMNEALHLIVSGAILCRSFIACKKFLKFLFTTKIRDEILYIRRKMDSMIGQLSLQIQVKVAYFYISQQQPHSASAEHSRANMQMTGEMERAAQTEICAADSRIEMCAADSKVVSRVNEWEIGEAVPYKLSNLVDRPQKSKRLLPSFLRLFTCLQNLRQHRSSAQRNQKPGKRRVLGISMDKRQLSSFSVEHESGGLPIHFTLKQLVKATNGFLHRLESYNTCFNLYKGTLSSGRQILVKTFPSQLASSTERTHTEIMLNELLCMVNLRHKNIVKLVGFCDIRKEEPMLLYDYPPNGRLSDFFFEDSNQSKILDWPKRLKIMLGVISALVYLHEGADEQMYCVHRDINLCNILLDDNFNAKVSEFSLAKILANDDLSFDGRSSGLVGTAGDIAQECFAYNHLSYKSDIYSFGVLMLEVISGRRKIDPTCNDNIYLDQRAWSLYKEDRLDELIDPKLLNGEGCELSSIIRNIKIALWCVIRDPSLRPTTSRVLAMISTEEEIPRLPDDGTLMEPHSLEHNNASSVRSDEGRQSEVVIEEIEELRA
ncbi:hypothetical protein SUGI_0702720 [Cryptomeria japonica]|nr:hypothetical protein SUGI_0702720 [Cryptomeria japonica]